MGSDDIEKREKKCTPPCYILFRSKNKVELYPVDGDNNYKAKSGITLIEGLTSQHCFSPNGDTILLHLVNIGVICCFLKKVDGPYIDLISKDIYANGFNSFSPKSFLKDSKGVQYIHFSSMGTYIVTWERPEKINGVISSSSISPNLKIWKSSSGKFLQGFYMRSMKKEQWPPIKWTHDEKKLFYIVKNSLHVYDGHNFYNSNNKDSIDVVNSIKIVDKIRCKDIVNFSLPNSVMETSSTKLHEDKYLISAFIPESKGKPARISLLRYPDRTGSTENPLSGNAFASKSFYQAEDCTVRWSPCGDSALFLTHTTVDSSGESYYGITNLYLLRSGISCRKMKDGEAISVPLPNTSISGAFGPVLDVSWMPNPCKKPVFVVISGRMPAVSSIHDGITGEATFIFGNAHRNKVVWSDQGRFLVLGGFGNLAGGMDFYDYNELKPIPQYDPITGVDLGTRGNTASCAVGFGWAPNGRYFCVSTTSPRMNVDNGVRLFKYNGMEVFTVSWDNTRYKPDKLLAVEFIPALYGIYADFPQTPPQKKKRSTIGNDEKVNGMNSLKIDPRGSSTLFEDDYELKAKGHLSKSAAYVPPAARKAGSVGNLLADKIRREREGLSFGATRVKTSNNRISVCQSTSRECGTVVKTKTKHGSRRQKQQALNLVYKDVEQKVVEKNGKVIVNAFNPEKRVKKIKKTLKQIEELKVKKKIVSK